MYCGNVFSFLFFLLLFQIGLGFQACVTIHKIFCITSKFNGIKFIAILFSGHVIHLLVTTIIYFTDTGIRFFDYQFFNVIGTLIYSGIIIFAIVLSILLKFFVKKNKLALDNSNDTTRFSKISLTTVGNILPPNKEEIEIFEKIPEESIRTDNDEIKKGDINKFWIISGLCLFFSFFFNCIQKKFETNIDYNQNPLFLFLFITISIIPTPFIFYFNLEYVLYICSGITIIFSLILFWIQDDIVIMFINSFHGAFITLLIMWVSKYSEENKIIRNLGWYGLILRLGYIITYIFQGYVEGNIGQIITLILVGIILVIAIFFSIKGKNLKNKIVVQSSQSSLV